MNTEGMIPVWAARNAARGMAKAASVRTRSMHIARSIKAKGDPMGTMASWVSMARMANHWLVRDAQYISRTVRP
jgi:hypothetical protein